MTPLWYFEELKISRTASYYDVTVDGNTVKDVAWYYPETFEKAKYIEGYIAFYKVSNIQWN
jgi:uncharacterized protein (DUF427 family)